MAIKPKTPRKPRQSSKAHNDPTVWLERAQAMQLYAAALKEADEKAYKFYEVANEQIKSHFEVNRRLYSVTLMIVILLLVISIGLALLPSTMNPFFQTFSLTSGICATVLLVVLLIRNPLRLAHQLLEKNMRINVAFLSFVRRVQQSDLALRFVFMQAESQDFAKVLTQIQDFQNIIDQTHEEVTEIMQDMG
jgi:hypothetical protein